MQIWLVWRLGCVFRFLTFIVISLQDPEMTTIVSIFPPEVEFFSESWSDSNNETDEHVVPINLITIFTGNDQLLGYESGSAAYDIALIRAKEMYPKIFQNLTRITFLRRGNFTCTQAGDAMVILMSSIFNAASANQDAKVPSVVLTPGCSLEVIALGDFSRELDSPLIASTAADHGFVDKVRFPNLIAMGPGGYYTTFYALVALLRHYLWTSFSIICDARSSDVSGTGAVIFCKTAKDLYSSLRTRLGIDVQFIPMDSSIDTEFRTMEVLKTAKTQSAVAMLAAIPIVQKQILAFAVDLDMSDGRYAFLLLGTPELSFDYDYMWTLKNQLTLKASLLLPYVIMVSITLPKKGDIRDEVKAITKRLRGHYNQTVLPGAEFNINRLSAYHSVLMMAQVLNESYELLPTMNGTTFAKQFHNRTFILPSNHHITISNEGLRVTDITLNHFNFDTCEFKVVHYYDAKTSTLFYLPNNQSAEWLGNERSFLLIKSKPPCGRSGSLCENKDHSGNGLFTLFLLLLGPALLVAVAYRRIASKHSSIWWKIDDDDIERSILGRKSLSLAGQNINFYSCSGTDVRTIEEVRYNGITMTAIQFSSSITFQDVLRHKKGIAILKMIKDLDHPNIAKFYGMSFRQHFLQNQLYAVLSEHGAKGLLRDLIDNYSMTFNWDMRISFVWDLINGLQYLHTSSPLGAHGSLNFLNCIIDHHFTLKISRAGLCRMYATTFGLSFACQIPAVCFLWMAPEILVNMEQVPTIAGDIYSLGVIFYEMATRQAPFNVDITDKTSINEMLQTIKSGKLDPQAYLDPNEHAHLPFLVKMTRRCWSLNPSDRPTLRNITDSLLQVHPQHNVSFTENLILRLENYNEELEAVVNTRTKALQEERENVDQLLSLVLPESIAIQLRNKVTVEPAYFEAVSILFSDIPAFNDMVANCAPFAIVDLLHRLYSALDAAISQFDVFKVETIRDSYMVSSGLPNPNGNRHVTEIAKAALVMLSSGALIRSPVGYPAVHFLRLRIGIHSGPCVGAVIGQKLPHYCLVGDTVNTASRMETSGAESKIHITLKTKKLLDSINTSRFITEERGTVSVKARGFALLDRSFEKKFVYRRHTIFLGERSTTYVLAITRAT